MYSSKDINKMIHTMRSVNKAVAATYDEVVKFRKK